MVCQTIISQRTTTGLWQTYNSSIIDGPHGKVKNIQGDSLDSIPSPPTSVKNQIIGVKIGLWCKGHTLLGIVDKSFE